MKSESANAPNLTPPETETFAIEAGLRYVRDDQPGFKRRRVGKKGFIYLDHENAKISSDKTLFRIRSLVIPPAWENVWICRFPNGHLQATGRDARRRKQYRYHNIWSTARNETKFEKLKVFGECLPRIREQVEKDLKLPGMGREKVLAAVVRVMELTKIRVGNDIYAEENESYGLTTIHNEHAQVRGEKVKFRFKGKSGILHEVDFEDPRLSAIIRKCQHLPGEELFAYVDGAGQTHDIGSSDVNDYLRAISGETVTAKDFRTWGATTRAAEILLGLGPAGELTERKRKERARDVIKATAKHLRNTTAVCRKYYVHPLIFDADQEGLLHQTHVKHKKRKGPPKLTVEERTVLELLHELTKT
jgi:DNA topoisomerase-1